MEENQNDQAIREGFVDSNKIQLIQNRTRGRGRPKGTFKSREAGYTFTDFDNEIDTVDLSDANVEEKVRGYFVGDKAVGRRKDVRKMLEDKVVGRIGKKGKYLVDKLFELIEGVKHYDGKKIIKGKQLHTCYKVPPNLNAIVYALDRVLGKPKQVNVQASFSLSQLLIKSQDGNGKSIESNRHGEIGREDNEEISERSSVFYPHSLESDAATDQGRT